MCVKTIGLILFVNSISDLKVVVRDENEKQWTPSSSGDSLQVKKWKLWKLQGNRTVSIRTCSLVSFQNVSFVDKIKWIGTIG